jgi:hypothetical protein
MPWLETLPSPADVFEFAFDEYTLGEIDNPNEVLCPEMSEAEGIAYMAGWYLGKAAWAQFPNDSIARANICNVACKAFSHSSRC